MKNRIAIAGCAAGLLFAFQGAGAAFGAAANPPAYIAAAIADSHRPKTDTERDADRLPAVMLGFSGVKPGDSVAELIPAGGYATRLLSAAVGPRGHIYSINLNTFNDAIKAQAFGPVTFLSPGEIEKIRARQNKGRPGEGYDRAWQYWLRRAGFPSDE